MWFPGLYEKLYGTQNILIVYYEIVILSTFYPSYNLKFFC